MKLNSISLTLDDADLNWLCTFVPQSEQFDNVYAKSTLKGVVLGGEGKLPIPLVTKKADIQTLWSARVDSGKLVLKLDEVRLDGLVLPAFIADKVVMNILKDRLSGMGFVAVQSDELTLDLTNLPHNISINLKAVRTSDGSLTIEG